MRGMNWITSKLLGMTAEEAIGSRALRDVAGSLFIRVASTLLQIAMAILLAHILPLESFGLFSLVISWVMVLAISALLGTVPFVQREIAVAKSREQWGRLNGILKWSTATVSLVSLLVFLAASAWVFVRIPSGNADRYAFWTGFAMIPVLALMQLWQAQLRGWGSVLAGQVSTAIMKPLLFILFLLALRIALSPVEMTASLALGVYFIAVVIALIVAALLKIRDIRIPRCTKIAVEPWKWLRASSRFAVLGGLIIINNRIGILMVGHILGKADTGLFTVAVKGANLLVVGLLAANMALSPRMAAFFHSGKLLKLQKMIRRAYRMVALITLPVVLLFVFFGNFFLGIFGPAYIAAWPALIILSLTQMVSVLGGPVGAMMNMAGQERLTLACTAVSLGVNIVANLIFIPLLGINGAALATLLSVLVYALLLVTFCYRRLGIWTPVLGVGLLSPKAGE